MKYFLQGGGERLAIFLGIRISGNGTTTRTPHRAEGPRENPPTSLISSQPHSTEVPNIVQSDEMRNASFYISDHKFYLCEETAIRR
jgi:hypothetical protein